VHRPGANAVLQCLQCHLQCMKREKAWYVDQPRSAQAWRQRGPSALAVQPAVHEA
jgi:hypothetical protein